MSFILGRNVTFSVLVGGVLKVICCARTCKLMTQTEIAGKSTIGSGTWKESKGLSNAWTITADGIVNIASTETWWDGTEKSVLSLLDLRNYQFNFTPIQIAFETSTGSGISILCEGTMLISSVEETGNYNDACLYSMQGVGTGQLSMTLVDELIGNIYYGVQDNDDDPVDFSQYIEADADADISIDYGITGGPKFFWMAHTILSPQKTNWIDLNDPNNGSTIGQATDLVQVTTITLANGDLYLLYMCRYLTEFTGTAQGIKFYIIDAGCNGVTNFAVSSVTNVSTDTGTMEEVLPQVGRTPGSSWVQQFQIAGLPLEGGIFTVSLYGNTITYTLPDAIAPAGIVLYLATRINALAISVPVSLRPPTTVSAAANGGDPTILDITIDYYHAAAANYTPASQAQVDFTFMLPSPVGNDYTIQSNNADTGILQFDNVAGSPGSVIVLRGYNYVFSIQTNCTVGSSGFLLPVNRYIP